MRDLIPIKKAEFYYLSAIFHSANEVAVSDKTTLHKEIFFGNLLLIWLAKSITKFSEVGW